MLFLRWPAAYRGSGSSSRGTVGIESTCTAVRLVGIGSHAHLLFSAFEAQPQNSHTLARTDAQNNGPYTAIVQSQCRFTQPWRSCRDPCPGGRGTNGGTSHSCETVTVVVHMILLYVHVHVSYRVSHILRLVFCLSAGGRAKEQWSLTRRFHRILGILGIPESSGILSGSSHPPH